MSFHKEENYRAPFQIIMTNNNKSWLKTFSSKQKIEKGHKDEKLVFQNNR